MAIKLASLFIEIAADGGKLTAELVKSKNQTKDWSRSVGKAADFAKKSFLAVGVGAGIASAGLTALFVSNGASLDALGKTASKLGDTTESLRTFGLAAEFGGVGTDAANKALQRMTDGLSDAAQGTGEAKNAIQELGLDAQRLARLRPSQAFEEITTALQDIPLASDRVRIAMDFFGTKGAGLVNVTRDVLQKARDDVEAFGGAVTSIDVAQIEAANDSVTRLQFGFGLLADRLTVKVAIAVGAVADQLFESATQGQQLQTTFDELIDSSLLGFADLSTGAGRILSFIDGRPELATGGLIGYILGGKLGFAAGIAVTATLDSAVASFDYYKSLLDPTITQAEQAELALKKIITRMELLRTPGIGSLVVGRDDELARLEDERRAVATILSDLGEFDRITAVQFEESTGALSVFGESLVEVGDIVRRTLRDGPAELVAPESLDLLSVDPVTILNGPDAANDEPIAPTIPDEEEPRDLRAEYFAEQLAAEKQFQDTWTLFQQSGSKDRLQILFNETSGALQTLAQHSRTFFEINRAASLANATVSIATGISRALSLPFPANLGAAATVALQGVAQIKTITSAKYGQGAVASVGGSSNPVSDTSSAGGVSGSSIDSLQADQSSNQAGLRPIVFTTPGASREQKAAEVAQALARAAELDLYQVDSNGLPIYNGSEDLDLAV